MVSLRMMAPGYLGVVIFLHRFMEAHLSTSCGVFGNTLDTTNGPNMTTLSSGRFAGVGAPLACSGQAKRLNFCYYQQQSNPSATFAIYRRCNESSACAGNYTSVWTTTQQRNTNSKYVCTSTTIYSTLTVYSGDIIVVCVPSSNGLFIAANISGASVNYLAGSNDCSSMINLSANKNVSSLTALVSLDVDECAVNNGGCAQICSDTTSGYNCSCNPGYQLLSDGMNCTNVNECAINNGGCSQICNDMTPGYNCSCNPGYQLLPGGKNCTNVNECAVNNGGCAQICSDTTPGYNCSCNPGYQLLSNGMNCTNVNECAINNGGCSQICNDMTPGYNCSCNPGYQLLPGGKNCTNVNECAINSGGCEQICSDTTPGYSCSCNSGYQLLQDGMNCTSTMISAEAQAIAASTTVIILALMAATAVIIIIFLWSKRYMGKLQLSAPRNSTIENVMYTVTTSSVALVSNKTETEAAVYEPLKDDEQKIVHENQASYEDPQCFNDDKLQPNTYEDPQSSQNEYVGTQQLFEQSYKSRTEDENPYYMPASCEEDLYVQLENHRIKKISRDAIRATKIIGSGQFGAVQMGIWNGPRGAIDVAIKTLNPTITQPDAKVKFLQEAAIMAQFRHPHVIQLYGIVCDGEPVMLILELAHKGDLRTHLNTLKPDPGQLAHQDLYLSLLAYSKQIADGMKYLSNKSFVHRDLAARNILVTQNCACKIADFGLSRDLADETYYVSHGGMVPIKWTAPEAIHFKKYSTASDVWSYGCLLYEIWSTGCKPYEGITNSDVVQMVDSGYRLPPPPGCPLFIYQLMIQCWHPETYSRPTFRDLFLSLCQSSEFVLLVPEDARLTHPQAGILGAPLVAGEKMYIDLQKSYV